ncbi:TPA: hypothetical protein N2G33_004711, partial [Salmonella enterica]|nr:hypothetical protein [Salmonella enterica]
GGGYGVSLTNGNMTATSGNISVTGTGMDPANGALYVNGGNFAAQNTVLEGTAGRNNVGAKLAGNLNVTQGNLSISGTTTRVNNARNVNGLTSGDNLNITVSSGALNITGKVNDTGNVAANANTSAGLKLMNAILNATDVSLSGELAGGTDGTGSSLTNTTINATTGNVTLNGTAQAGNGTGVSLSGTNMTATSGNISVTGTGMDSANGALYVNGGNFSAQNTVLEGTAGRNNVGAKLAGNINVTQGNLSVTGSISHLSNGTFTGLLASSGLDVNVSHGNLSLTGQALKEDGNVVSGNTVGLNLTNATLSAQHATLKGSSANSGSGFILNNVTLQGGIAQASNMTFSSAGSAANVSNFLNVSGGIGFSTLESLESAGIDNNTTVGAITASESELKKYMNFSATSDWIFDVSSLNFASVNKPGVWTVGGLTGINATTTGNITLTGVNVTNSNLTGSSVSLAGAENAVLTVTDSTLNATMGNISLTGNAGISLSGSNMTAGQDLTAGGNGALSLTNSTLNATVG